jgi:6-phosphogluconolactonase
MGIDGMIDHPPPTLRLYPTADRMIHDLSDVISMRLADGIRDRGQATLVASGGTTPGPLYDELARSEIPWDKVVVTLTDERWVPEGAEGSNEKLVRDRLLKHSAKAARFLGLRTDQATKSAAEAVCQVALAALPTPHDVTLVGMGADGHTASLYPHAPGLERALDASSDALTAFVNPAEAEGSHERLSLTLRALLDSRVIIIMIRGEEKLTVYRRALAGSSVEEAPIRALIHQTISPVEVWWAP